MSNTTRCNQTKVSEAVLKCIMLSRYLKVILRKACQLACLDSCVNEKKCKKVFNLHHKMCRPLLIFTKKICGDIICKSIDRKRILWMDKFVKKTFLNPNKFPLKFSGIYLNHWLTAYGETPVATTLLTALSFPRKNSRDYKKGILFSFPWNYGNGSKKRQGTCAPVFNEFEIFRLFGVWTQKRSRWQTVDNGQEKWRAKREKRRRELKNWNGIVCVENLDTKWEIKK